MRSLCTWLAGVVLSGPLVVLAAGCGGSNELEKPPDTTKQVTPENDMPGYKDMQAKTKKAGK